MKSFRKISVWNNLRFFYATVHLFLLTFSFAISNKSFATIETIKSGSFLINMGITPQTIGNGLKPYGLLYDMLKTYRIPIKWIITTGKAKDAVDFIHNGISYKGGTFIISAEYRTSAVNSAIASWQSKGVVGSTSVSDFSADVYTTLQFVPNWTLDQTNGAIAVNFFVNAGIPSSAYGGSSSSNWKLPSQLGPCDDIFVLPHADPTWAIHNNLYYWNKDFQGNIWVGCHAISVLESLKNPGNTIQMNFLSTNGLVIYTNHGNGIPPYNNYYSDDPVMQFMGGIDNATTNGSERIYMPSLAGAWNTSTKICVTDPLQGDIPSKSPGPAAVLAYGRSYGDITRGFVMYEAGHDINKGASTDIVAAQRAFFNFSFYSTRIKTEITLNYSGIPSAFSRGDTIPVYFTFPSGIDTSQYKIKWTNSCGGKFLPSDSQRVVKFVAPTSTSIDSCLLSVTVTDQCTRQNFASKFSYIIGKVLNVVIENFSGNYKDGETNLAWLSKNQSNITKFEIERSLDGNNFIKIADVPANSSLSEYTYRDKSLSLGVLYYRLKITDLTEKYKYSSVISINCGSTKALSLSVIPNPVNNNSVILIYSKMPTEFILSILNLAGTILFQKKQWGTNQQNIISFPELEKLPNGYYILNLRTNETSISRKIIIIR